MGGTGTRRRAARRRRTGQPRQDLLLGRPVGAAGGAERSALLVCATQGVVPRRRRRVSAVRREGPPPRDAARVAYAEVARKRSIASSTSLVSARVTRFHKSSTPPTVTTPGRTRTRSAGFETSRRASKSASAR